MGTMNRLLVALLVVGTMVEARPSIFDHFPWGNGDDATTQEPDGTIEIGDDNTPFPDGGLRVVDKRSIQWTTEDPTEDTSEPDGEQSSDGTTYSPFNFETSTTDLPLIKTTTLRLPIAGWPFPKTSTGGTTAGPTTPTESYPNIPTISRLEQIFQPTFLLQTQSLVLSLLQNTRYYVDYYTKAGEVLVSPTTDAVKAQSLRALNTGLTDEQIQTFVTFFSVYSARP